MKMSTFDTLDQIIEKALVAVRSHPQHDLDLGYRHAIWAMLETPPNYENRIENIGKKRRLRLALLSAKHVLPLWEKIRPDDNLVHQCLAKVEQSLFEKVESLHEDYMNAMYEISDLEYEPPIMAGYSAINTLSTALWDERFDPASVDYSLTNADLDPDYTDSALFASYAYANGSIWEEGSSTEKRLEFWEWWLLEAVPTAWRAFPGEVQQASGLD